MILHTQITLDFWHILNTKPISGIADGPIMINGKETNNGNDAKNASAASSASKRKKSTTQNDATVSTLGEAPLELHLWSWEVVRYKYKFYAADEVINATYTKWITINFLYTYFLQYV